MHEVWRENDARSHRARQAGLRSAHIECTKCNNADQYIVEYEKSSPWVLVVGGS